jgi:hypothetical protein
MAVSGVAARKVDGLQPFSTPLDTPCRTPLKLFCICFPQNKNRTRATIASLEHKIANLEEQLDAEQKASAKGRQTTSRNNTTDE